MKARLLVTCLVVFAGVPSGASAANSPELTYPTGTRLGTEKALRAINIGNTTLTSTGSPITCSSAKLEGTVKKNTGTEIEADVESASFNGGGACTSGEGVSINTSPAKNGVPWCFRATPEMTEDEFQLRGGKCSEATRPIRLVTTRTTKLVTECVYQRSAAVSGTFTTHPTDAVLTSQAEFTTLSGPISCISAWRLDTSFTFERDEVGSNPLYVSAGPLVTFPTGTALGVGSTVKAANVGSAKFTSTMGTNLFECSTAALTGTLRKNSGTEIEADIETGSLTGTGPGGTCPAGVFGNLQFTLGVATNGLPWCLRAPSKVGADEWQLRGNKCSEETRPIRITYEFNTFFTDECVYERAAALAGTFTTHPEDAVLNFTHATFLEAEPKSGACPDETQLDSSMTLERAESGTHPMYIS